MDSAGEKADERAGEKVGLTAWEMAELTPGGAWGEAIAVVGALVSISFPCP
jgi:hypothetical protein